jgi:hypothetical protein
VGLLIIVIIPYSNGMAIVLVLLNKYVLHIIQNILSSYKIIVNELKRDNKQAKFELVYPVFILFYSITK